MPTLQEIAKRHREKAATLKPAAHVAIVAIDSNPPTREKKEDTIRVREGGENMRNISNMRTADIAGTAAVVCQDCRHFQSNRHTPDAGLGSCTRRQPGHPDRGQWPRAKSNCSMYEGRE